MPELRHLSYLQEARARFLKGTKFLTLIKLALVCANPHDREAHRIEALSSFTPREAALEARMKAGKNGRL